MVGHTTLWIDREQEKGLARRKMKVQCWTLCVQKLDKSETTQYTKVKLHNIQLVQGLSSAKVCVRDRDQCITRVLRTAEEAEVCILWEHTREIRSKHKMELQGSPPLHVNKQEMTGDSKGHQSRRMWREVLQKSEE